MPEVVDEVRLVIESALLGNTAPLDGRRLLDSEDRFLKAHDPEILLGRDANLLFEEVDKVFLGIPGLIV